MSDIASAQMRELIGSTRPPNVVVPDAWTEKNGRIENPISGVLNMYCVALTKGDIISNAKSWKDHTADYSPNFMALLLFILSAEWTRLGNLCITVSHESDPALYNRVVEAIGKKLLGFADASDYKMIEQHVGGTRYVNMKHQNDVADMKVHLKEHPPQKGKKKKKNDDIDLESDNDEDESRLDVSRSNISMPPPSHVRPIIQQFTTIIFNKRDPVIGAVSVREGEVMAGLTDEQLVFDNHSLFMGAKLPEADQVIQHDTLPEVAPGDMIIPKVSTTFTHILDKNGTVVGYLVQFLQHDPAWNPGKMIDILSDQIANRKRNQGNGHYRDPWPQYMHMLGTNFPAFTLNHAKWVHIVNSVTGAGAELSYSQHLEQQGRMNPPSSYNSRLHPSSVFSLRMALLRLSKAGGVVYKEDDYYDSRAHVATFPHVDKSWRLLPDQVFWDDGDLVGLIGKHFPGVAGNKLAYHNAKFVQTLTNCPVITRKTVMDHIPYNGYRTNNSMIYFETEGDTLYARVKAKWDDNAEYRKLLTECTEIGMDNILSICQLDGSVASLSISAPLKATLTYLKKYLATHDGKVTRNLDLSDPSMTFFGNAVSKDLIQYETIFKIIHTHISFQCQGLMSVAQRRLAQLLFSMIVHGEKGYGKSFCSVGFTKNNFIPGTVTPIDRLTGASDQTDQGVHDEIRACDEFDQAFVSEKHGNAQADKVNLKKGAVMNGEMTIRTFEKRTVPGIGELRGTRDIRTALNYTEVANTNAPDVQQNAIASRYYKQTIKGSSVPATELGKEQKQEAQDDLRVYQALSYWGEKAMGAYAIGCREPNMQLWTDVTNRMFEYLVAHGVIDLSKQARILEVMTPFARQMVLKNAINMTWNIRGAPCYEKPFDPTQFREMAPYLYCTTDIVLFVVTLLSNEVVHEDLGDILQALYRLVVGNSNMDKTTYELYQYAKHDIIKTDKNPHYNREVDGKLNQRVTDLNYLQLGKDLDTVAAQVAPLTKGKLSVTDVKGGIERLAGMSFRPRIGANGRNGYCSVPSDDLKRHKVTKSPKFVLKANHHGDSIGAFVAEIHETLLYDVMSKIQDLNRIVLSSYRACKEYKMSQMHISDSDLVFLYRMRDEWAGANLTTELSALKSQAIESLPELSVSRIVRSFASGSAVAENPYHQAHNLNLTYQQCVLILFGFERGYIMEHGVDETQFTRRYIVRDPEDVKFPHFVLEDDIPQIYNVDVSQHSEHSIRIVELSRGRVCFAPSAVELFDRDIILEAFAWATICESTLPGRRILGWSHPDDISQGDVMEWDQAFIDKMMIEYSKTPGSMNRQNGVIFKRRGNLDAGTAKFLNVPYKNSSPIETVYDLDHWSAETQHKICGRPPNEPVRDPKWILENYKRANGVVGTTDYPKSHIAQKKKGAKDHLDNNSAKSSKRHKVK